MKGMVQHKHTIDIIYTIHSICITNTIFIFLFGYLMQNEPYWGLGIVQIKSKLIPKKTCSIFLLSNAFYIHCSNLNESFEFVPR